MMRFAALLFTLLMVGGCQSSPPHRLVVFAAASLTKSFTTLSEAFTATDPGAAAEPVFAGSADLLTQLTGGAEADVLATADVATMTKAEHAGLLAGAAVPFATNHLIIAVAPGNPKGVKTFADLARVGVVVCARQVPCGSAIAGLQARTGVKLQPLSEESSVTDVLNKVTSGQADAGVVYVTDVQAAGDKVTGVPFPEGAEAVNTYPIAVLKNARDPGLAHHFIAFVTGDSGWPVLAAAGFGKP